MLYCFPEDSIEQNWLHEAVLGALKKIHENVQRGGQPLTWPHFLAEEYREKLRRRTGLRNRLKKFQDAFIALSAEQQTNLMLLADQQNRISDLLSCDCDCRTIETQPDNIKNAVAELFDYCFGLLIELGMRDKHYESVLNSAPRPICPFCGREEFEGIGLAREDYDHYLPRSKYPFSAINFYNLVPMGNKCNRSYKGQKNLLLNEDGERRRSFNPYGNDFVKISLRNSRLPLSSNEDSNWVIDFFPPSEEAETWDDVFLIRTRYRKNFYERRFASLLDDIIKVQRSYAKRDIDVSIEEIMRDTIVDLERAGLEDNSFLKSAFYDACLHQYEGREDALVDIFNNLAA